MSARPLFVSGWRGFSAFRGRVPVDFVRGHGYESFRGPVEIRKWPRGRLQVVVRVTGRDGQTFDAILESEGSVHGCRLSRGMEVVRHFTGIP